MNRMLEPLAIVQGMMGLRTWLTEVQYLMTKLKQRAFSGMGLWVASSRRPTTPDSSVLQTATAGSINTDIRNPRERQVLTWYSAQWRQLRGGPVSLIWAFRRITELMG